MATIIRGTTPTITFTFADIDVNNISVAIMTVKQSGEIVIEKTLADASIGEDSLSWKLTQEDSLKLVSKLNGQLLCDWLLTDGTRGRSNVLQFEVGEPAVNRAI